MPAKQRDVSGNDVSGNAVGSTVEDASGVPLSDATTTQHVTPATRGDHRIVDTTVLLATSAWLIFNSHLEAFYPRPWLAADGLLGNTMFFLISGYGIQSSLTHRYQPFTGYAIRRVSRLYPAVILAVAIFALIIAGGWRVWTPLKYLDRFIWPTAYTYVRNIVPFYVVLWLIGRRARPSWMLAALIAGAVALVGAYIYDISTHAPARILSLGTRADVVTWCYYWMAVCLGATMALYPHAAKLTKLRVAGIGILLLTYFAIKFVMVVQGRAINVYPVLHVLVLTICGLSLLTLGDPTFARRALGFRLIGPFIGLSAALTLEIYLTHQPMVGMKILSSQVFPLNILLLAVLTIISAIAIHWTVERLGHLRRPSGRRPVQQ